MLKIGKWNTLHIEREAPQGLYLSDGEQDVLLPNKYVPEELHQEIDVFIYKDSEDRWIATTLTPKAEVGQIAVFFVKEVNRVGAFVDWGLEKDLFIPYSEQKHKLEEGDKAVAYVAVDPKTNRIVATTRLDAFLSEDTFELAEGQEVSLIVIGESELGYEVLINKTYTGLVYKSKVYEELQIGDEASGKVVKVREDGKVDVHWFKPAENQQSVILQKLQEHDGFLDVHDKSSPEKIKAMFNMSKKEFKRQIGMLYKARAIKITKEGIALQQQ